MENMTDGGKLYLVSTPIGNLKDITLRALEVLKSVDLVAAEDTRHTRELLTHFDIHVPLESFHAFNEHRKTEGLLDRIASGLKVAAVSDAGTPSVADPGFYLARAAIGRGIEPEVIPGVSAVTFAVTASGLPVDKFSFWAFAPVKSGRRRAFFEAIRNSGQTVFFFESPYRMAKLPGELAEIVGADAQVAILREATKLHEEALRGTAAELAARCAGRTWKGEFVIGIHPASAAAAGEVEGDGAEEERR
ncbi:MAG: 16S rRNA (cytidine(1402)-2'-O)-methyltransferase [Victivallaceae bacterium]|nr:16S rRNA (cytidine(1402)-2'-O)-methyltransferase [Victivallaceae bacterium]